MAIALRATGTPSFGVNSFAPAIPAAQVTGDMMLLLIAGKPFDATIAPPGDWTFIDGFVDGTVAAGVDTGSMFVAAYYKEAASDTETNPTITEGLTPWNVVGALVMVFSKGAGESWAVPAATGGGDATAGTGFSVTGAANPGVTTGDVCVSFAGFRSDAATPCSVHLVATQTGVTFTNTHDPATDPETTTGGDMGMCVNRATVSGTGSAAPVMAATLAAAHTGSAMFVRLRVSSGSALTANPADTLSLSDAATLQVQKGVADSIASLTDAIALEVQKAAADSVSVVDAAALAVELVAADTVAVADNATTETGKEARPADAVGLADATVLEVRAAPADALALVDAATLEVQKAVADTVTVADGISFEAQLVASDTVVVSDAAGLELRLVIADTVTVADEATTLGGSGAPPASRRARNPVFSREITVH